MDEAADALVERGLEEVLGATEVDLPLLGLGSLAESLDEGQVIDGVHAFDGFAHEVVVAHVTLDELRSFGQVLRRSKVEDANLLSRLEQSPGQERTGETRAASHKVHATPPASSAVHDNDNPSATFLIGKGATLLSRRLPGGLRVRRSNDVGKPAAHAG